MSNLQDHNYTHKETLLQERQYAFPYHWLPRIEDDGSFSPGRFHRGVLEYFSYMDFASSIIEQINPANVLDVGCGEGRLAEFIEQNTDCKYEGVDVSTQSTAFARAFLEPEAVRTGDVNDIKETYEVVTLMEVLEHIPDQEVEDFLGSVCARLEKGGTLVVSVPTKVRPVRPKHFRHYDKQLLTEQLEKQNLELGEMFYIYRVGWLTWLMKRIIVNRLFALNTSAITRLIMKVHRKYSYFADEETGGHIVAIARK